MNLILGAALIIGAIAVLHLGRLAVQRVAIVAPARVSLVADVLALTFAAMFGPGLLLLARELMAGLEPLRIAAVAVALGAAVLGARLVSAAIRRAARAPTTPAP